MVSREQNTILADSVLEMNRIGAAGLANFHREADVMTGLSEQPRKQQISRIIIKIQIHAQAMRDAQNVLHLTLPQVCFSPLFFGAMRDAAWLTLKEQAS